MVEVGHAAEQAVEHGEGAYDAGASIMHHILDAPALEVPFTGRQIPLPQLHLFGQDISITKNVVMMWIVAALLLLLFVAASRRSGERVPRGLRNLLEVFVIFVRDEIARKTIGPGADRYVPYLLTTFFFILGCNLLGLVPGMATATGNISVTMTLALISFVMTQFAGIREYGVVKHFVNLVPPGLPSWILPILIPVEILGMLTKPFALMIRLFANMTAGHVVILSLISLIFILETPFVAFGSVPFALFINLLEILVCFIQAYIFTMLTSLFIGMAAHPAH